MIIKNFSGWLFEQNQTRTQVNQSLTKRVNFPAGLHSAAKANLEKILVPSLADIETFLKDNTGQVIQVELFGSESAVPNYDNEVVPKAKLAAGELSKKRISTIKTFMSTWLDGLVTKGIITQKPEFKETVYTQPASEWNPPAGATPDQIKALAGQDKYKMEQYLEVRLSVIGEILVPIDVIKEIAAAVTKSARTPNATKTEFNKSVFYNYSVAPGAVLGKTLDEIKQMPGALLTMNDRVRILQGINTKTLTISPFSIGIEGVGGQNVSVVIENENGTTTGWSAVVAPSYKLTMASLDGTKPYVEGSKAWKIAWLIAHWYFMRSSPRDWDFISNKPTGLDWTLIGRTLNLEGTPPTTSADAQAKLWPNQAALDQYIQRVKSYFKK
jgi:hypothetical protein